MTSYSDRKTAESVKMIPMEMDVDGGGKSADDNNPKREVFLDEYIHDNSSNSNSNNSAFLLEKIPFPSSSNKLRKADPNYGIFFRKRYILIMIVTVTSVFSVLAVWGRLRKPVLRFRLQDTDGSYRSNSNSNSNSSSNTNTNSHSHPHYSAEHLANQTFKIIQITDIHLGEAENTDWGPWQDAKTFALLERIFDYEPDCDLIVLGGDQLTANNCLGNCTEYYGVLGRFLSDYGVPWAMVFGNHDDMDFEVEDGSRATIPHSYTRRDLLRVDQKFSLSLSKGTEAGKVAGVTNYVLDVLDPFQDEPALQIFFLDSGGGTLQEAINDNQIEWFREQAGTIATAGATTAAKNVPAVAFQHIPTWQHEYNNDGMCFGYRGEGVDKLDYDAGIVHAMIESGRFHFLAVGHNHGNDYCCRYNNGYGNGNDSGSGSGSGSDNNNGNGDNEDNSNSNNNNDLYFCFGRHSGYGGYGKWDRGVRIYELLLTVNDEIDKNSDGDLYDKQDSVLQKSLKWRTWVRLESGEQVDFLDYDHRTAESKDENK